ncbi:MAG: TIGR00725 family protein [Aliifodinibius sp.]|nr:TIGR00725 family protein [Fodinibius sp.]NIV09871.1 TIGR00725 family protein [Fodinibius sp.]NIY29727.1 TIGR00725 family protein [Fodinibius sp.]
MSKPIIGVMGPGEGASQKDINHAYELGQLIAKQNWILLTGGRNTGVMDAASKGAKHSGGLTVGILPSESKDGISEFVDIPICTGMGSARNNINVLSSDVVIACGSGAGTISEVMLALKAHKPVILLNPSESLKKLLDELPYSSSYITYSLDHAVELIKQLL